MNMETNGRVAVHVQDYGEIGILARFHKNGLPTLPGCFGLRQTERSSITTISGLEGKCAMGAF